MNNLTLEEVKYMRHLLDVKKWKLDKLLQKVNGFEKELLFREMLQVSSLEMKFLNLYETLGRNFDIQKHYLSKQEDTNGVIDTTLVLPVKQ